MLDEMRPTPELAITEPAGWHACLRVQFRLKDGRGPSGKPGDRLVFEAAVDPHGMFRDEGVLAVGTADMEDGLQSTDLGPEMLRRDCRGGDIRSVLSGVLKLVQKLLWVLLYCIVQPGIGHRKFGSAPDFCCADVCQMRGQTQDGSKVLKNSC